MRADDYEHLLLPGLPVETIISAYLAAPGNEIASKKFENPESSSALVANTFGFFFTRPADLPALTDAIDCGWPVEQLTPEAVVRFPWTGGRHPCLDLLIETRTALIGVELKRYEPFRFKKKSEMSDAYWRDVWGAEMGRYERCRDAIRDGQIKFARLDAVQLIKHAFGLRTAVNTCRNGRGNDPSCSTCIASPSGGLELKGRCLQSTGSSISQRSQRSPKWLRGTRLPSIP